MLINVSSAIFLLANLCSSFFFFLFFFSTRSAFRFEIASCNFASAPNFFIAACLTFSTRYGFDKAFISLAVNKYDSLITFEISTDDLTNLPQAGSPVFLELDYKSNTQFLVGVYINYSLVVKKELIWINPKENWNKIYIDLTNTISEGINAPSFSIFIGMKRDYNLDTNAIYFDNIRVIY